ncbi:hypothetical protein COHA_004297 [Chlorella ohadii]|uniref:non-specific serine/threonine protein kinase n=1 Tax=Chlorella ohadii TaxID=2649997 RepID=A0AAD5H5Y3_9CHLO|nr:hypothetical protein COHA_004297 [Chlorella ohadii]
MTEAPERRAPSLALSLADFELLRRIGDGSYSHVVLARHKATGKEYALKVVDKQYIIRHKVVEHIKRERAILDSLADPGIVQLFFTFQVSAASLRSLVFSYGALYARWKVGLVGLADPGIVELFISFQDARSLYLGLEHCPNGELYDQIRLKGRLDEAAARFYAAEVVLMLGHLRQHAVVHRDLKPENLLLDAEGHLKLIDFGSAKRLSAAEVTPQAAAAAAAAAAEEAAAAGQGAAAEQGAAPKGASEGQGNAAAGEAGSQQPGQQSTDEPPAQGGSGSSSESGSRRGQQGQQAAGSEGNASEGSGQSSSSSEEEAGGRLGAESKRAVSLVGTADYVSPEVLNNGSLTCAADLWALGCVIYQMLAGRPPFKSLSEYLTFQKIVEADYELPEGLSEPAADLIRRLLQVDPAQRIGAEDLGELQAHPFFDGIDWASLRSQMAPDFIAEPSLDPGKQLKCSAPGCAFQPCAQCCCCCCCGAGHGALSSANSSFDWELQSLASALPHISSAEDTLALE